jgi:hypothetical protein
MWKIIAGRQLEISEAETLLREKSVGRSTASAASRGVRSRRT